MTARTADAALPPPPVTSTSSTPLTLQRLLDTQQATAILPGLLYFASTGECLSSSPPLPPPPPPLTSEGAAAAAASSSSFSPSTAAWTAAAVEALHGFYYDENPFVAGIGGSGGRKASKARAIPTARAAVGRDAVFISLRGLPPYLYRPFFADFGPLDLGCCVHFARRLTELLRVVTGVDVCSSPNATAAGDCDGDGDGGGRSRSGSASSLLSSSGCGARAGRPVVVCASLDAQERVNTACLVGAFCVLSLGWSAASTWYRGFADIYPGFLAYRDASQGVSNYPLSLMDVWAGLEQGVALGLVNVRTYDLPAFWEGKLQDYSWVVPRRFLAMSSPQDDKAARTAEVVARRLRPLGVRMVVRLNDSLYSVSPLLRLGIRHVDLPYADGSVPSDAMLLRFLNAVEEHFGESAAPVSLRQWWSVSSSPSLQSTAPATAAAAAAATTTATPAPARATSASKRTASAGAGGRQPALQPCSLMHSGTCRGMPEAWTALPPPPSSVARPNSTRAAGTAAGDEAGALAPGERGAVAVHCLAGLGRTGTMLAVYMMRHYGFTSRAVIGWLRLCRPGSITGIQQQYLDAMERRLRPPPHILTTMQLGAGVKLYGAANGGVRFGLPSRATRSSPSSGPSRLSILISAAAAAPGLEMRGGVVGKDIPSALQQQQQHQQHQSALSEATGGRMRSVASVAAFQTHGSVVADARPATATVIMNGHIKRGGSGTSAAMPIRTVSDGGSDLTMFADLATWSSLSGGGAADLAGLRGAYQQQQQQQQQQSMMRRFSNGSTATLSLSTIRPEGVGLDVVARMPVLGDSDGGTQSASASVSAASPRRAPAQRAAELPPTRTPAAASAAAAAATAAAAASRASVRVGDYKYASTYFVALEQGSGSPSAHHRSASSSATPTAAGRRGRGRGGAWGGPPRPATGGSPARPATVGARPSRPGSARASGNGGGSFSVRDARAAVTPPPDECLDTPPLGSPARTPRRRRPYTATAAVCATPRAWQRQQRDDRRADAADASSHGSRTPGGTPPWVDLVHAAATATDARPPSQPPRHRPTTRAAAAVAAARTRTALRSDGGGGSGYAGHADLDDTSEYDIASCVGGAKVRAPHPPSASLTRPSLTWHEGPSAMRTEKLRPLSSDVGGSSSTFIHPSSLPMWGRPTLRT
ncbi:tyrosine phosphatase [Novymonas esmeraldas]|uniref:Tyrosine phosphatase n=1 Tax=Novymonas esmeraldas TaxID=1808958 RepID=A0AAW0EWE1_9TRYP